MNMNQFTQLLILIFIASSLHLSASETHKTDTIGTFNEITDIELRIKSMAEDIKESDSLVVVVQDSILVPVASVTDSLKIDEIVDLPKKESVFTPVAIKTSLDSLYARKDNGIIQFPDPVFPYELYISSMSFREIGRAHV